MDSLFKISKILQIVLTLLCIPGRELEKEYFQTTFLKKTGSTKGQLISITGATFFILTLIQFIRRLDLLSKS